MLVKLERGHAPKVRACEGRGSASMAVQRPLKLHEEGKVNITISDTATRIIVLALASLSFYAKRTRIRDRNFVQNNGAHNCCSSGGRQNKGKRKRREENGFRAGHANAVTRVVSPYFRCKEGEQVGNDIIEGKIDVERGNAWTKGKRNKGLRERRSYCEAESTAVELECAESAMALGVSPYSQKGGALARVKDEPTNDTHLMEKTKKETSVPEKRRKDGNCCRMAKGEEHDEKTNAHSGSLNFQQEDGVCNTIVKHKKKAEREVLTSVIGNVDTRLVSRYFVKESCGHKRHKGDIMEKGRRRRKKKVRKDQSDQELENDAEPQKVVSHCFQRQRPDDQGTSQIQQICKEAGTKLKKLRNIQKRRPCDEFVGIENEKKVKKQREGNTRTHDEQLSYDEKDVNKALIVGPQGVLSPCPIIKIKNQTVIEGGLVKFTVSSALSEDQDGANCRVPTTEIDVEVGCSKNGIKEDCIFYGEPEIPSPPSFRSVKRKRIKPASLLRSKIEKDQNGLILDGAQEESDILISGINRNKKKKKMMAASLKNCMHETEGCLQVSISRKVSPYFQKEQHGDKRDNCYFEFPDRRKASMTSTPTDFEELLLKYGYKYESKVNREVGNVNDEVVNSNANGSVVNPKKQRAIRSGSLTAAEKKAEAYRRKAPHNTWMPPRSPFNLLQERHAHDPWRILVICMLLNVTTGPQVKQVLSALFSICPNAEEAVSIDATEIQRVIRSLGLHRKRAAMIQRFSSKYLSDSWTHVTQLPGIGKYAADAYAIFCNGMWDQVTPNDHMLKYYWKFLKNSGL